MQGSAQSAANVDGFWGPKVTLNSDLDKKKHQESTKSCTDVRFMHESIPLRMDSSLKQQSTTSFQGSFWVAVDVAFWEKHWKLGSAVSLKKKLEVKGILPLQTLKQFRFRHFSQQKIGQ